MNNWIVCRADLHQKERQSLNGPNGTKIELFISNQYNENLRERNPNYCEVVYSGNPGRQVPGLNPYKKYDVDVEPGDIICVQHFQLMDHSGNSMSNYSENGEPLFFVNFSEVFFKIVDGVPILLNDYILCEKLPDMHINNLDYEKERFLERNAIVTHVSKYVKNVKVGDKIKYEPYADYEVDINGKKYIRMRSDEVLGTYE